MKTDQPVARYHNAVVVANKTPELLAQPEQALEQEDTPEQGQEQEQDREVTCIRVLVVDDHEVVRRGVSVILAEQDDFEVVGQAGTANEALALARKLRPDIVLLDVFLGESNGLDVAQQLLRACPEANMHVVILTGHYDDESLFLALRVGVHGFLQKALPAAELLSSLRAVYRGERVVGEPHAITQVLNEFRRITREQERLHCGLTDQEIELVRFAASGCTNKEIAARKFWSEVTVKRKMQDIYRKLQVTDRAQAVAESMRMGLI
jgi:DNA-binding NarL/FixJ family response regulator